AETIGLNILKIDPRNVQAKALVGAATKRVQLVMALADGDNGKSLLDKVKPNIAKTLLSLEQKRRKINTERVTLEINNAIKSARRMAAQEPDFALDQIKEAKELVVSSTDMEVTPRQQLLRRLESVREEIVQKKDVNEQKKIHHEQHLAGLQSQRALADKMKLEEEKLEQLIDRFAALINEFQHGDDDAAEEAKEVARAAIELNPSLGGSTSAFLGAQAASQLRLAMRMRALRADRFLETLRQVELSHVPFPDEPPIRWPAAEVWQALTERRKKWGSVSLETNSKTEEKINKSLDELTELEFDDATTLAMAVDFLAVNHGISILFDNAALEAEGIEKDSPLASGNLSLSGIKLRSALRLILEPLNLTYVIKNEVMMITSEEEASNEMSTRVYPVGDLVIPIITPQSGGIGSGRGGAGGFGRGGRGGGRGGFGGGGGGFGGGGFGGGRGGGGGGFFMLPQQAIQPQKAKMKVNKNARMKAVKKAVLDPEVQGILNNILKEETTQVTPFQGQAFAQVKNQKFEKPFRLDNKTIRDLKKKQ
ncbi:hypothetical protein MNBD_PLANCTO02-3432, partial [hydrothermal vent metagenome]